LKKEGSRMKGNLRPSLLFLALCLFVTGCGLIPATAPPAPRNTAEALAQAHVAVQEVTASVARLVDVGGMTTPDARICYDNLLEAEDGLLEAHRLLAIGDGTGAQGQLDAATALILLVKNRTTGGAK
jgi:hypothetical protein